jgi:hypothetical protein
LQAELERERIENAELEKINKEIEKQNLKAKLMIKSLTELNAKPSARPNPR